jgi:2-amino-4-hydroxy-6-hydroxymethyldihydropteridine diphosphokinase
MKDKMESTIYLGIGTNLGNRLENLHTAIEKIANFSTILKISRVYESEPWGFTDQPQFLNMVIKISSNLNPYQLLEKIKKIEVEMGREPIFRYGPRLIDIDILFFDDLSLQDEKLEIPHAKLHERSFVLIPLMDISPELIHPGFNQTIKYLSSQITTNDIKEYYI